MTDTPIPPGELTALHLYTLIQEVKSDVIVIKTKQSFGLSYLLPTVLTMVSLIGGVFLGAVLMGH